MFEWDHQRGSFKKWTIAKWWCIQQVPNIDFEEPNLISSLHPVIYWIGITKAGKTKMSNCGVLNNIKDFWPLECQI